MHCLTKRVLYIERRSKDMVILQRPHSAEITGELEIGKTYLLTSERHATRENEFYAIKAEEIE